MKIDRALAIVRAMGRPKPRRVPRFEARPSYTPVRRAWTWANATPQERGKAVRDTADQLPQMTADSLRELFNLTWPGLVDILRGQDWRPEHDLSSLEQGP